jgi:acyl-[acyl-carrier-protein]-phospholipid O-acyltransferase/long-chain-fatty-acid--[acyl-carrier-protein] ligase
MAADGRLPSETRRSLTALLCTQFLGALNDNLFKMVVSLLAVGASIEIAGGSAYLSAAAAVFILPYLLFSGYAGFLADRLDKRKVVVLAKIAEVAVMGLAVAALLASDIGLLIGVLFLMATQSVFFSPAKYGMLPEMLPTAALPRANGLLEASRYVAIILGTVIGAGMLMLWRDSPLAIGAVLVMVAIAGTWAALHIRPAAANRKTKRFRLNPWAEVRNGIRRLAGDRKLAWTVAGTTYFDFVGNLTMLDMLLVGKLQMGLDELQVGLLGASAGLGMGLGCALAGALSRNRIEMRLVAIGALGNGLALWALSAATGSYALTALAMLAAGAAGGLFLVPLNAFLQARPGKREKGLIIATNNFLNMSGVLISTATLWVLHDLIGLGPLSILVGLGTIGTLVGVAALWRLTGIGTARDLVREVQPHEGPFAKATPCASES